eukprot:Awhi_evm1s2083
MIWEILASNKMNLECDRFIRCPSFRLSTTPEVLHPDMHYGFKIDLWSLGIIAYVSMTCLLPEIPLNTANPEDVSFANPAFDNISNE